MLFCFSSFRLLVTDIKFTFSFIYFIYNLIHQFEAKSTTVDRLSSPCYHNRKIQEIYGESWSLVFFCGRVDVVATSSVSGLFS